MATTTKTTKTTLLVNTFHGTEYRTRLDIQQLDYTLMTAPQSSDEYRQAKAAQRRIWKRLCGIEGCTCGDGFGARP
jgi:hypothetical protein